MKPTFMSLFTGIGGFDLGLERAGWECVGQCDNDPFCNKVLAKHWPGVKRYDDVRNIGHSTFTPATGQQLGGGDPSRGGDGDLPAEHSRRSEVHAGRWAGSGSARSRAGDEAAKLSIDLICGGFPCQDLSVAGKRAGLDGARSGLWFEFHRILSELRPAFCLIENVPGLLSSNGGADFAVILGGLEQLGYAVGWAVLDSQHFGVAQRRRRVYVVGGPSRSSVQQVLSLCESGDWHPAKGRAPGENVAGPVSGGAYGSGRRTEDDPNLVLSGTLNTHDGDKWGSNQWVNENKMVLANTLPGHHPRQDLDNDTYIPDASPALTSGGEGRRSHRGDDGTDAMMVIQDVRGLRDKKQNGIGIQETETMYTLDGTCQHGVSAPRAGVRRLTPVECERLQGFPDDWTLLDDKTADGPRYKACGNAVTVPVIEYIGLRMREVLP